MKDKTTEQFSVVGTAAKCQRHPSRDVCRGAFALRSIAYRIHYLSDLPHSFCNNVRQNGLWRLLSAAPSPQSRRSALVGFAAAASGVGLDDCAADCDGNRRAVHLDSNDCDVVAGIQANVRANGCVVEDARLRNGCPSIHPGNRHA